MVLSHADVLDSELKPIDSALGQTLAEHVLSPINIPPMANTAMDGYAVRWADVVGASLKSPRSLKVSGLLVAGGRPDKSVLPGASIRIMTGAPIPPGADTIIPFEDTDEESRKVKGKQIKEISILKVFAKGACVRPAGEDISAGQKVLSKGTVLSAADIGVLASVGKSTVRVVRRPSVAIISTGDELVEPGTKLGVSQIYNSNSYTLATLVLTCGAIPRILPVARDTVEDLTRKMASGLDADFFITSAGVSTGEYDLVKDVLTREGSMDFWRVRMRPGRPLAFGFLRRQDNSLVPHLGLPGNTVATMVTFDQFARPAIYKMMAKSLAKRPTVAAVLQEPLMNRDGRRCFVRAILEKKEGRLFARVAGSQGSNILTSMVLANGLLVVREDQLRVEAGEEVEAQVLEGHEYLLQ